MATRLYCPSTGAAPISPAPDADWEISSSMDRLAGVTAKISSAMASKTVAYGSQSAGDGAVRQYIFPPMDAQTISGTVKAQIRCSETDAANNVFTRMGLRVVSNDGTVVRGTLLAVANYGPTTEFVTSLTNRTYADGDTLSSVVAQAGDRIVAEFGIGRALSWIGDASLNFGDDSGTDLPEDESTTAANNPWIEFSMNIAWQAASVSLTPGTGSLAATGVIPSRVVGTILQPPAGALSTIGNADSLIFGTPLRPDTGSLVFSGVTPDLRTDFFLTPAAGALLLTGQQGTLNDSGMPVLTPGTGVLTLAGVAPIAVTDTRLTPPAGALILAGQTPVRVIGAFLSPLTGALVLVGQQPTMTDSSLPESLAPVQTRYAPRPLLTLTIGATTKRYSTEDVWVPAAGQVGVAQVGESQVGG